MEPSVRPSAIWPKALPGSARASLAKGERPVEPDVHLIVAASIGCRWIAWEPAPHLGRKPAESIATRQRAAATQGSAVILGQANTGATAATGLDTATGPSVTVAEPSSGSGVAGSGSGTDVGVSGSGGSSDGIGVIGVGGPTNGAGVAGFGSAAGDGVPGTASAGSGCTAWPQPLEGSGLLAENTSGGTALKATGPAAPSPPAR